MAFKILVLAALALATVEGRRLPKYRPFTHNRIVGGDAVSIEEYPFIVSFQDTSGSTPFHFCAASLYNKNWVITAAHCVSREDHENPQDLRIVAGKTLYAHTETDVQALKVIKIVSHENYGQGTSFSNDIAVMQLSGDVVLNDKAQFVGMPNKTDQGNEWGGFNTVIGWGRLSSGGGNPEQLMAVEVPFVSDTICRKAYGEAAIADSMICTGEEGKDSCQGDSGGPMVFTDTKPMTQTGVVSWGRGCALAGYPGVYTELAYFVEWVEKNTQ